MHPVNGRQSLFASIKGALRGFTHVARARNAVLLVLGALLAQGLLFFIDASLLAHGIIALCCTLVIALEMINTSIEELADVLVREHHPGIAKTKEIAAGAVLLMTITTALTTLFFIAQHTLFFSIS